MVLSFVCLVIITFRPPLKSLPSPWEFPRDTIQYFGDGSQFRLNKQVQAASNAAAREKAREVLRRNDTADGQSNE